MPAASTADLPLHYGRVPPWLANRMATLGRAIVESICLEYGRDTFLQKLSDPLWFQSLGAVLGMDWHSSGITTSVVGALKRAINPMAHELGLYVCGGRGKHSRQTPRELMQIADRTGLNGTELVRSSRLTAKIDNTAIQDGFQIYLHAFFLSQDGKWVVVQQGMNEDSGYARRYHWHSQKFASFLKAPHTAICGQSQGLILNLTDPTADSTQEGILQIGQESPSRMLPEISRMRLPAHHDVRAKDVDLKRLGSVLAVAYESGIQDFESFLLLKGLGPRTLQSLTLVSEVIHGTPSRFTDPARYSFAHGGKDGHPFPVPLQTYDETISTLKRAVERAKIGHSDKQRAIQKLHQKALEVEKSFVPNNRFSDLIARENMISPGLGGRTVMDDPPKRQKRKQADQQLRLF